MLTGAFGGMDIVSFGPFGVIAKHDIKLFSIA